MTILSASTPIAMLIVSVILVSSRSNSESLVCPAGYPEQGIPIDEGDIDLLQFAENLEHLEAEYFLWGALGYGLDQVAPQLVMGGPPPIGVQKANLDPITTNIIQEFGLQEVAHLRALKTTVGGFPRPLMDLGAMNFAKLMDSAFGYELEPAFDPYRDSLSYMIGSYVVPYVGFGGLLAGLLGVEAGQDAVIREYLYQRAAEVVHPYNHTVAEFTVRISALRNRLAACGIKDEGLVVPSSFGAENRTETNVLSADYNSLSYSRTPPEILRTVYATGDEHVPGGFFPHGGNGKIARAFIRELNKP